MSFQPILPAGGYAGWLFLSRTRGQQQAAFDKDAQLQRDTAYFAGNIGKAGSAGDLVADRRLLKVALGAFGLEADIGATAFVRKVLEGGALDSRSLANRLGDKRYLDLTRAFGFGDFRTPNTALSDFAEGITAAYRQRRFEAAVGEQNREMRLALGFGRDLQAILDRQGTDAGRWYAVMGNPPVKEVVRTALGLPAGFDALDIDRQLDGYRAAADRVFGSGEAKHLADPQAQEKLLRLFLIRSEAAQAATDAGRIALTLLQSAAR